MIPQSSRDLNESVDFLKDLLKKDSSVRGATALNLPSSGSNAGTAYGKGSSFHQNPIDRNSSNDYTSLGVGGKRQVGEASAYKNDDSEVGSTAYRSSSRHLDRKAVRYEGQSAADDLSEMRRQLANTQKMLDAQATEDDAEEMDSRELQKEMDDLRYQIRRVQDDIEYYNRRPGSASADARRKAERDLMHLMHERLPQLEKRMKEKEERQSRKDREDSDARNRRNDYSDSRKYGMSSPATPISNEKEIKGTFEREEFKTTAPPPSASSGGSAPPPPPPPAASTSAPPPPAAPTPSVSSVSAPPPNLSPAERSAWMREQAQKKIQERMRVLGLGGGGPSTPSIDTGVEARLAAEKAEAEARSAQADQEAAAREAARRTRLEEQKLEREKVAVATAKTEVNKAEESSNPPPKEVTMAQKEQINEEEEMLRRREDAIRREKEERLARFKKLEEEEEEAKRQEQQFREKQESFKKGGVSNASSSLPAPARKPAKGSAPPPPSRSRAAPVSVPAAPPTPVAPPAPPAPPAPSSQPQLSPSAASGGSSTNPFYRMQQGQSPVANTNAALPATGGTNPFFRSQQADGTPAAPPAPPSDGLPLAQRAAAPVAPPTLPASASGSGPAMTAPKKSAPDDDWGDSDKEQEDEEEDGPGTTTRATRSALAAQLFSGLVPGGKSTPPASSTPTRVETPKAPAVAPDAPAPPPSPPGMVAPPAAPPAPAAPTAPPAPMAPALADIGGGTPDRGALLSAIQGGARLKKAQTNDRSKPPVAGAVIGDASAPVQKFIPPPSPPAASPALAEESLGHSRSESADDVSFNANRQSVDWAGQMAHDAINGHKASQAPVQPSVVEEAEDSGDDEGPEPADAAYKSLNGNGAALHAEAGTELEDYDLNTSLRTRALYTYDGHRDEDLSLVENQVVVAHPAKSADNSWWYGSLASDASKKGFFPATYVQEISLGE